MNIGSKSSSRAVVSSKKKVFLPEVIIACAIECGNVTSVCFEICVAFAIILDP